MSQTILGNIGSYKSRMISALIHSPEICELLFDDGSEDNDGSSLVYTRIFPYLYLAGQQSDAVPYICVELDLPALTSRHTQTLRLTVWIYCHKNCMNCFDIGDSGTRVDVLSDLVQHQLQENADFGIGALSLDSVTYLDQLSNDYYGKQLIFTVPDFRPWREKL